MAEFVFTSPGVKFKERDLTFVTRNVGVTTLGLVGETEKGPAFEPVFIQDQTQFRERFGRQNTKKFPSGKLQYELPYVANAYLEESNQLYVTRVLGLSGYDAGTAWAITLSAGHDPETVATGATSSDSDVFENNIYMGVPLYATGDTGFAFSGFTKVGASFAGTAYSFTATTVNPNGTGQVDRTLIPLTADAYEDYEDMVLAVIRSRARVEDELNLPAETIFETDSLIISGNSTNVGTGDLFGNFNLVAYGAAGTQIYSVSLNPNASNFLPNVIGREPKDRTTMIWTEAVYADLIKKLDADGLGYGVNTGLLSKTSEAFTNYKSEFKTPETPWVVSQLKGNKLDRLFRFVSISDGDAANREIKISITNIKPESNEFDVQIRAFSDNDENPNILESYSRCTMNVGLNSYIGRRIGTIDGEFNLMSKFVMVEIAPEVSETSFPAGFEGYQFKDYSDDGVTPKIFYKTSYGVNERINRVYLGISEKAYNSADNRMAGTGINQNFFNFNGLSGFVNTKGFHMDSGATGTYNGFEFEVGVDKFQTIADTISPANAYFELSTRKFTLVPAGGFDGWDVHRRERSYGDLFRQGGPYDGVEPSQTATNDFQAWETAINTYSNPEEVTINLFATPGINWSEQNILVKDTIEMIERDRTDTLYVVDSPDVDNNLVVGDKKVDVRFSKEIVGLLETADVDSSYACTYFPYIQIRDAQNNVNLYLPPTGEVVKAMAFTDNTKFPWFAPAGLQRGVTDANKSKYKLSLEARDIVYGGRINPLADFAESGTAIFGQKTLQIRESALNRINVRRLLLQIKVLISNIATRLVFEQNDQTTIDQFLTKATPVLDVIKRERGLQEFRIKMDDSINTPETMDRNELYGEIGLKPTRAVEFIGITFTITPSGASFDETGA